jgi:exocyst complex component 2
VAQVKDNFERFISCKRTIDDIHSRLRESEASEPSNGVSTSQLSDRVVMLKDETQRSFSSLLERHQQVTSTRLAFPIAVI